MAKRADIDRFLFDVDRLLEDQHFPPEYWSRVDDITEQVAEDGFSSYSLHEEIGVYVRPMVESFTTTQSVCERFIDRMGFCSCTTMADTNPLDRVYCWACQGSTWHSEYFDGLCDIYPADVFVTMERTIDYV